MFEVFGRSWELTKLSFGVVKQDKEMLLFPLLAGVFSLLYAVAMIFPTVLVNFGSGISALGYVAMFFTYFGLAFIATYFNVCVVYTTKIRFGGGDATFMDSIRFANSRLALIAQWSLVSASVGLFLRMLDQLAEKFGAVGQMIMGFVTSVLGMIWTVLTLFVVPTMVYEDVGPMDAIKRSAETLKKTWGESLVRHYGLGLIQMLFMFLGVGVAFILFTLLGGLGTAGLVIAFVLSLTYFLGVILIFNVANNVFNTALYVYAKEGRVPGSFGRDTLENAFRAKAR